jgi:hypothetical protein
MLPRHGNRAAIPSRSLSIPDSVMHTILEVYRDIEIIFLWRTGNVLLVDIC